MDKRVNYMSDRKKVEVALQESEERYWQLFENLPDPIIVHLDRKILFANQAASDLLGFTTSREIIGKLIENFIHEKFVNISRARINSVSKEKKKTPLLHIKIIRANGQIREAEFLSMPFMYRGQTAVQTILRDITLQKRVEQELQVNEELFRGAFDNSAIGKAISELDGRYTKANEAFCKFVGYSEEELLKLSMHDITISEDIAEGFNSLNFLLSGISKSIRMEKKYIHKSGDIVWGSVNLSFVRDASGCPKYLIGEIQDITQRKLTQEALEREMMINEAIASLSHKLLSLNRIEEISSLILDYTKTMTKSQVGYVGHIDSETGFLMCTTMTEEVWDICKVKGKTTSFKDFQGLSGWVLISGKCLIANSPSEDSRSQGTPEGHVPIKRFISAPAVLNGETVGQIALANSSRFYSESDLVVVDRFARLYALAIQRNRAEQKLMDTNQKLQTANQELEKISQYKSEFFATMSHELRTPLAVILAITNELLAKEAGPLNRKQVKYIKSLFDNGEQLLTLINNILDLSKAESGKMVLNLTESRIGTIARSVIKKLAPLAKARGIRLKTVVTDSRKVIADTEKVRQVISNLLDNAIKFSSEGQVELTVYNTDEGTNVEVRDSGPGIPEEEQAMIFEAFYQVNRGSKKEYRGTGLGLALVKKIVDLHMGEISVNSWPGIGTEFTVFWPAYPEFSYDLE